jgi:hypothetical protein
MGSPNDLAPLLRPQFPDLGRIMGGRIIQKKWPNSYPHDSATHDSAWVRPGNGIRKARLEQIVVSDQAAAQNVRHSPVRRIETAMRMNLGVEIHDSFPGTAI